MTPLRVAIVAAARHPIREPFAGGLEAHTWLLATALRRQGHRVGVFAAPGSDPDLDVTHLPVNLATLSEAARADSSMCPEWFLQEHHAYLDLMVRLSRSADWDVVHNNSLHYLPIAMAAALPCPMVATLHTPPTPWIESALQAAGAACAVRFAAVSTFTARSWGHLVPTARVIRNGVDTTRWSPGPGGGPLVWMGRMVAEKGPHLAAAAARAAGVPLVLAGPLSDPEYFAARVAPLVDGETVTYAGHLPQATLARLVGQASASLVTPCWDEPYGLVVAESLACETPVLGFAAGAVPDLVDERCGRLVPVGDVPALTAAILDRFTLDRRAARQRALEVGSAHRMVDAYVDFYQQAVLEAADTR